MWKIAGLHICQGSSGPAMFRMAGTAGDGLVLHHLAMHGLGIAQLGGNIVMTDQTTVAECIGIPEGGVAFGASVANFSMGRHTANILSGIGIQAASRK
jgi:hypothetical protein